MSNFTKIFHDRFVYNNRMERLTELISDLLDKSKNILDLGCGDGKIDSLIMERKDVKITGVDVLVREKTYIPVQEYDGTHIPYNEENDTIMAIDVLHHTDDPAKLVKEMARCSGKYLIIKDHYRHGICSYIKLRIMDYVGNAHYKVRLPYNYLTPSQWNKIFADNNLKVIEKKEELNLYSGLFHILFDGHLHFIVKLEKMQ